MSCLAALKRAYQVVALAIIGAMYPVVGFTEALASQHGWEAQILFNRLGEGPLEVALFLFAAPFLVTLVHREAAKAGQQQRRRLQSG